MIPAFDLGYGPLQSKQILLDALGEIGGLNVSNDGTKTTLLATTGDYLRIGDAGTATYAKTSEDDLLVTGKFEVDGQADFDGSLNARAALQIYDRLEAKVDGAFIRANQVNANYLVFQARDTDTGNAEVGRLVGAADPYFQLGGVSALRVTLADLVGFFAATPVAQQGHITDTGGDDATAVNAILVVLENFGLVASS